MSPLYVDISFNGTEAANFYTLSLHDALPISNEWNSSVYGWGGSVGFPRSNLIAFHGSTWQFVYLFPIKQRSEEHTSELQSREKLVCRLLLEKKKKPLINPYRLRVHLSWTSAP